MTEQEWRKEFARRLRVLSNDKDLKKQDLAEATGLSKTAITRYHKERRTPDAFTILKLAKALDCDVADLIPDGTPVDF